MLGECWLILRTSHWTRRKLLQAVRLSALPHPQPDYFKCSSVHCHLSRQFVFQSFIMTCMHELVLLIAVPRDIMCWTSDRDANLCLA